MNVLDAKIVGVQRNSDNGKDQYIEYLILDNGMKVGISQNRFFFTIPRNIKFESTEKKDENKKE